MTRTCFNLMLTFCLLSAQAAMAQVVTAVNINRNGEPVFKIKTDDATFTVSINGKLRFKGARATAVKYYNSIFDEVDGRLQSIGNTRVTYYDRFSMDNRGYVKSIGGLNITYYDRFDMDNQGKIKTIGNISITYYDRFDMDNCGLVKTIGNTRFNYYTRFDGQPNSGRIKSVQGESDFAVNY